MANDSDPPSDPDFHPSRLPWGLRPAEPGEAAEILRHALKYEGRRRSTRHDDIMAGITTDHMLKALEESGFVLMRKPPREAWSSTQLGLRLPGKESGDV